MSRAVLELVIVIQPGDCLTLRGGAVYAAAGNPSNPSDYMQRERGGIASPMRYGLWMAGWMVAVKTSWGEMPVSLHTVVRVERGGSCVWSIDAERVPVQMELF